MKYNTNNIPLNQRHCLIRASTSRLSAGGIHTNNLPPKSPKVIGSNQAFKSSLTLMRDWTVTNYATMTSELNLFVNQKFDTRHQHESKCSNLGNVAGAS